MEPPSESCWDLNHTFTCKLCTSYWQRQIDPGFYPQRGQSLSGEMKAQTALMWRSVCSVLQGSPNHGTRRKAWVSALAGRQDCGCSESYQIGFCASLSGTHLPPSGSQYAVCSDHMSFSPSHTHTEHLPSIGPWPRTRDKRVNTLCFDICYCPVEKQVNWKVLFVPCEIVNSWQLLTF